LGEDCRELGSYTPLILAQVVEGLVMARDREHIPVWLVQAKFPLLQHKNYFLILKSNVTKMK
jgi:hypothetical protein